ncbi:MAG: septum formation protein Maf [Alphaproteobacteria bacterium RIFOXYD12_FULL_60_8]|nr:MAG: septum formation protein Maf [Alphaproteobacteria bacterium RIFOXYD12_FULL_60_8]
MSSSPPLLVLASGSSARRALLDCVGVSFIIDPPGIDEDQIKEAAKRERASTQDLAETLADLKARRISVRHPGALVIGADQVLEQDGTWFDKPGSRDEARAQLRLLRGKTHQLVTSAVVIQDDRRIWHHTQSARLTMRSFSEAFLEDYLDHAGEAIFSAVGGYHLEGRGAQLFSKVEGDYFTILGLPLLPLLDVFRNHGALIP